MILSFQSLNSLQNWIDSFIAACHKQENYFTYPLIAFVSYLAMLPAYLSSRCVQ